MEANESRIMYTPLRNSKRVNKPYQSPINADSPTCGKVLLKNDASDSPLLKRRRLSLSNKENTSGVTIHLERTRQTDIQILKRKIILKKSIIEDLRRQLLYNKKHNSSDLKECIKKWREACTEALERLQKDVSERNSKCTSMTDILNTLNIPKKIIGYSEN